MHVNLYVPGMHVNLYVPGMHVNLYVTGMHYLYVAVLFVAGMYVAVL